MKKSPANLKMTIKEAAEKFVSEMNTVPTTMIQKLMDCDPDSWEEVTVFQNDDELDDTLPMWNTMWSFDDWTDNYWLSDKNGIGAV